MPGSLPQRFAVALHFHSTEITARTPINMASVEIDPKNELALAKEGDVSELENASPPPGAVAVDSKTAAGIRHTVDWRLIPALGAMYGVALMDRSGHLRMSNVPSHNYG